jgi:dinuclear metal center YbgI/SA1388 family protein
MPLIADLIDALNSFATPSLAADWDNTGLIIGDAARSCARVMTCLTVTPDVVAEALTRQVSLIVSHHPVLFKAIKRLTADNPDGKLLLPLLTAGIAVHSPHTAFDNCPGGINDGIAKRLQLQSVRPLRMRSKSDVYKLVVFVPESDLTAVSDALFAAGAGHIGNYSECSFRSAGVGTFKGDDTSNPTIGVRNRREDVAEFRLEVIVPAGRLDAAVAAMRAAHSYEVPAYDIDLLSRVDVGGEGRVGTLPRAMTVTDLAEKLKSTLNSQAMQVVTAGDKFIQTVAIACGAAGEFLGDAIRAKAHAFVTGELRFHDMLRARDAGIAVILPGHYASERPGVEDMAAWIHSRFPTVEVWPSTAEHDPLANLV